MVYFSLKFLRSQAREISSMFIMSDGSPPHDENRTPVCRFASGTWQVERTQIAQMLRNAD